MRQPPAPPAPPTTPAQPAVAPVAADAAQPASAAAEGAIVVAPPTDFAEYSALRVRDRAVRQRLEAATDQRGDLAASLTPSEGPVPPPAVTAGIEARIAVIDARILRLEAERDAIDRALAQAPAGLVASQASESGTASAVSNAREEGFGIGLTTGIPSGIVLLLLIQAWRARRRRGRAERADALAPQRAPAELVAAVEAMAIEVERIGEGQRFITQLLADDRARTRAPLGDGADRGR